MKAQLDFAKTAAYCDFDYLPEGLEAKYECFEQDNNTELIPRSFLTQLFEQYFVPDDTRLWLTQGIEAIERDTVLFPFTKFLAADMCTARNRCDEAHYTNMTPGCMKQYGKLYSFLLLLACVVPSMEMLEKRGVPRIYYENIPHQPIKAQLEKIIYHNDCKVHDFPWVMNFYTCAIFLLDRFYFIPHRFADPFTMYRHSGTGKVIALHHADQQFRSDGQRNGVNDIADCRGSFISKWEEDDSCIIANRINPMGFVEREAEVIMKQQWKPVLQKGDILLALHIPSGPGYTPDRLKASMKLAIDLFTIYFPELIVNGFWSSSWLYDTRLSLLLDNVTSNIIQVQRQFYIYPTDEGDGMLRYELFGDWKADPVGDPKPLSTSLQRAAAEYMKKGGRFNTLSMVVLAKDIEKVGSGPYVTEADIEQFGNTVDSHL